MYSKQTQLIESYENNRSKRNKENRLDFLKNQRPLGAKPNTQKQTPNRLPIGCPEGTFPYFRRAIRAVKSATYVSARPLITQRS